MTIADLDTANDGSPQGELAFLDRDLAWLEFNRRVLNEAIDRRTPLLERLNFLSIFSSNLDEFVMKRVYGLREQVRAGVVRENRHHYDSGEVLAAVRAVIGPLLAQQAAVFRDEIRPALAEQGIHLLEWPDLTDDEREAAGRYFEASIFPTLTPLAVDVAHPFPFISNLSTSLGVMLADPESGDVSFARVKVPGSIPQWIRLDTSAPSTWRFLHVVDLLSHQLDVLFPGMEVRRVLPFRVTRNVEVDAELDDVEDLLEAVEEQLRQRRMETVVRLEYPAGGDEEILRLLMEELELGTEDVYEMPGLLEYRSLRQVASLPIARLHYRPWRPVIPARLRDTDGSLFDAIRAGDILVHHPYDSFDDTVLRFVREAVDDPEVLAIKMTIYRTGTDSPFVPLLIRAAELGKQVACLVELKARFDEQENIQLARRMEKAGVHVVYGLEGLKTHTKTTLVVRREGGGTRSYAHIGTGNYHHQTARLYVDLGLFTCRPDIATDLVHLFNYLTGRSRRPVYRRLLVAPQNMRQRFVEAIAREVAHLEAGRPAHIVAKMNQLEDRRICRALYHASQLGVPVDLIVRGFSVLRPRVPGLSDNIRTVSVIGRFLEHSRIFYFRNGEAREQDGEFYIGSADWMHRNLDARVEAVTPVDDRRLRSELWEVLQTHLADQRSAWDMLPDGSYVQRQPTEKGTEAGSHQRLMDRAKRRQP